MRPSSATRAGIRPLASELGKPTESVWTPPAARRTAATPCVEPLDGGSCVGDEGIARGRERDVAAVTLEEMCVEHVLEPANRSRESRLSDVEPLGCAAEVQLVGHREEVLQVPGVDPRLPEGGHRSRNVIGRDRFGIAQPLPTHVPSALG